MKRRIQIFATILFGASCFLAQAQVTIQPDGITNGNSTEPNTNEIEFEEDGFLGEIDLDVNGVLGLGTGSAADDLFIGTTGNIGIDIDNPVSKLHILNGDDVSLSDHGYLLLGSTSERNIAFDNNEIQSRNNGGAASLLFNVEGGNVGIGTTSPGSLLHLNGGDLRVDKTGGPAILLDNNNNPVGHIATLVDYMEIKNLGTGSASADLSLQTENAELHLDNDGNIGINTDTPDDELHIIGNSENNPSLKIELGNISNRSNNAPGMFLRKVDGTFGGSIIADVANETVGANGGIDLELDADDDMSFATGPGGAIRMFINNNGEVGIGTENPDQLLSVNGDASKVDGGEWSTFSDEKLKKNIRDFEDGLEQILQIRPVWYRYNGKANLPTEEEYVGVIAQEIQQVAPYTVESVALQNDADSESYTDYLSYNGTAVTYMLVNAVQEQQAQLDEKEERIDELEARLEKLEALLTQNTNPVNPEANINLQGDDQPRLEQNTPNPFDSETQIKYYLPKGTQQAQLRITDLNGKVLKMVKLQGAGEGQINVSTNDLPSGNYQYSLFIGGKLFATKQMVLTK